VHALVKIGMGSQCGFLLDVDVVSYPGTSVGSATDPVIGIFSDVDSWTGTVRVAKESALVSGSSEGSSSGPSGFSWSWGYGKAAASAARALTKIAMRMLSRCKSL
jgi:hypothetical protein